MEMKRHIIALMFLFTSVNTFAQSDWYFETKIERNNHYLLEGNIADKYPITMYLERDGFCLYEDKWTYAHTLKGWYYYNNKKIKLPLIGSEKYYDEAGDTRITPLYVPNDALDSIRENSCDLEKFSEIFVMDTINGGFLWKKSNSKSFLPVKLKEIRRPSPYTKVFISLYVKGIEMLSLNLTDKLREIDDPNVNCEYNYIDYIEIGETKKNDNDFYLTFSFSIPSVPRGIGMGHCGAGTAEYSGFLHISSFEVKELKYYQTYSCFELIPEKYRYFENPLKRGITAYGTAKILEKVDYEKLEKGFLDFLKDFTENRERQISLLYKPFRYSGLDDNSEGYPIYLKHWNKEKIKSDWRFWESKYFIDGLTKIDGQGFFNQKFFGNWFQSNDIVVRGFKDGRQTVDIYSSIIIYEFYLPETGFNQALIFRKIDDKWYLYEFRNWAI